MSPFIVAELAASHNGSLDRALRLIDAAAAADADAIKLQTYTPDTLTLDHAGPGFLVEASGPWQGRKLYDLYSEAATPYEWHERLFDHARDHGLIPFSTPFDPGAVDFLETLDCPRYKIASFEIVDLPLIRKAASTGKPLVISTGMASDDEITEAVIASTPADLTLLHCVSEYPAKPEHANLRRIPFLRRHFGVKVGLSDHTLGIAVPVAAAALGATMIEKHLTLRRDEGGPDAAFSLEPHEFADMVAAVRDAAAAVTIPQRRAEPYRGLRRSLYAVADIAAGEAITEQNVRSIRPGRGLVPKHLPELIGRKARAPIARGTPMSMDLVS